MRILGIDPGTLAMGYGLIEEEDEALTMLDFGVLTASAKTPPADRLYKMYGKLLEIMACHKPDEVAIEEPFVAKNARSALAIGRAQAIAMLAASSNDIPIYTYAPTKVKQSIAGYGRGGKEQIQQMVKIHLGLSQIPQPDDAADALAVALCHLRERQVAKLMAEGA
ncbi:crossover junction endodeoxyribonuclease RuvC [Chloroflexota bacterium]